MSDFIACSDFPCLDTDKNFFLVPYAEINPQDIKIIMISEAPPPDKKDYFYAPDNFNPSLITFLSTWSHDR